MAESPLPTIMPTSPISPSSPASQHVKDEEKTTDTKAGKCGLTLFEYKCGHTDRISTWNLQCGGHEKCDAYSAVIEVVGAPCDKCGVFASVEDGFEVKKEDHSEGKQEDRVELKAGDGDVKLEAISSSINKTKSIVNNPFGRTNAGTFGDTATHEEGSSSSRASTPFSVLDEEGVAGAMSDDEVKPASFVRQGPVVDEIETPATPSKKNETVEAGIKLTNGSEKQYVAGGFDYTKSRTNNHAPIVKLPTTGHEQTDRPSTPTANTSVEANPNVINGVEEQDLAGGFEYVLSPVKNHVAKVRLPVERDDVAKVIEESIKNSPLQATAQPFVSLRASSGDENCNVASPADKHQGSKSNGVGAEIPREEVAVTLLASLPKPIKVLDRCSRFQPLGTRIESNGETVEQKKLTKYTPPMLWKHASAENENSENTWIAPKVKENTMMNGKSIHDDDQRAPSPRIALSPIDPYNSKVASQITVNESLEHNGNTLGGTEGDRMTDSAFAAMSTAFGGAISGSPMNARQSSSIRLPRAPVSAPKAVINGVNRNKVPFLPSKSENVIIKEETMDAETEKLKKLQRTLATLAITQEVEVIFAKVQREQKIKLEDWFANVAPMHLAAMEKAAKNSRDRDTQIKALRASFADNGKFLSSMLVDQLLADAKEEVIRMCEEGVEKLVNSLL